MSELSSSNPSHLTPKQRSMSEVNEASSQLISCENVNGSAQGQ